MMTRRFKHTVLVALVVGCAVFSANAETKNTQSESTNLYFPRFDNNDNLNVWLNATPEITASPFHSAKSTMIAHKTTLLTDTVKAVADKTVPAKSAKRQPFSIVFRTQVINTVLKKMDLYSSSASNFLLGTAIQESHVGQLSSNIFQLEASTIKDINRRYLSAHPRLRRVVGNLYDSHHSINWNIHHNVPYQVAIARLVYLRTNQPLPEAKNLYELGRFWKVYYNTYLGLGTAKEFKRNFINYVGRSNIGTDIGVSSV